MANEYTYLKILDVRESRDQESGEVRIYADCVELNPRSYTINLTKQKVDMLNKCRALKGRAVMFPTREGTFNGRGFVGVGEGDIIPVAFDEMTDKKPAGFIK